METLDDAGREQVDRALQDWKQGDCALGEHWFLSRVDPERPLTQEGLVAAEADVDVAEAEVLGFVVVTQTCDIVRPCARRPFVEVCPLVEVDDATWREVERGKRPNYAHVPGLAEQLLVADLDRVMTVEKSVAATWERVEGCPSDEYARRLLQALARKRARFAYPDDFVALVSPLLRRMSSKHDKDSDEGRALRALREIRVRAAPSWDATQVELTFWFIRNEDEPAFEEKGWHVYLEAWLARVKAKGRFQAVEGLVQTLDDLTAREYVESDLLDLDHLSSRA